MAEKDLIVAEKLDHSGIFDFSALYSFCHGWYKNEEYGVVEEKYAEKVSGNSRDIVIEWKASKKMSDYFKLEHKIVFEISGLTDVEIEIDGKKKKANKGKVSISIKGILVSDIKSEWEATPTYKFLRGLYDKYIFPSRVDSMETKVKGDVTSFKEEVKAFLELSGKR